MLSLLCSPLTKALPFAVLVMLCAGCRLVTVSLGNTTTYCQMCRHRVQKINPLDSALFRFV